MKFVPGLIPRKSTDRRFVAASLAAATYVIPATIDYRAQLLPSNDQGQTPKCAAYAMAGWLEFYNWKYHGDARQIDPDALYDAAKQIDGEPNVRGTTLEAVLQAAQNLNFIAGVDLASIRQITASGVEQALHRYGVVLSAFEITESWETATPDGWLTDGGLSWGGHAVLVCGYSLVDKPPWYAIQNSWGEHGWRGFNRMSPEMFKQRFMYGLIWDFKRS